MKKILILSFLICSLLPFLSLADENTQIDIKTYKYTFSKDEPFKVSYADYPKEQDDFYELEFEENALLPPEIKGNIRGLKISGNNHSDDLFMYAYKKLEGLKANTKYQVNFSLEFASNAPLDSMGVGGSPGSSVFVKIGAVAQEPERYADASNSYRIRLDKGNQKLDGKAMLLIGTIGVDTSDSVYRLKTLPYQPDTEMQEKFDNYTVTSNEKGEVWLIVGTDSGYESKTTIFYTNIVANFKEIK